MDQMEGRKWEELPTDCLVNVFTRVGLESLILDVPTVCKSWYKASLSPECWKELVFFDISTMPDPPYSAFSECQDIISSRLKDEFPEGGSGFSFNKLLKFAVNRSRDLATRVWLPSSCNEESLLYLADKCRNLKELGLSSELHPDQLLKLPELICKWQNLQSVILGQSYNMREIFTQISVHCKRFESLVILFACRKEASDICTILPNIKSLELLVVSEIEMEDILLILKGCRELSHFIVSGNFDFEFDEEIMKLASGIDTFKCFGSCYPSLDSPTYWYGEYVGSFF